MMVKVDVIVWSGVCWIYSLLSDLLNVLERRVLLEIIGCGDGMIWLYEEGRDEREEDKLRKRERG